eukprot:12815865-Ditylum_brightwellii.AAC.1
MNFESGKRRSPSHPSCGGQVDATKADAKEEGERTPVEKGITTNKAKNMKAISKHKGEVGEVNFPKPLIMSLFEDKDVKKAIRAS